MAWATRTVMVKMMPPLPPQQLPQTTTIMERESRKTGKCNMPLCFMFIRFADFRCLPCQALLVWGVSCYSRRQFLVVVRLGCQYPLRLYIYATLQQNFGHRFPLVQIRNVSYGEANKQAGARYVIHSRDPYDLVSNLPKLSQCYRPVHELVTTGSRRKEEQKQKIQQMSWRNPWLRAVGRVGHKRV